MKCPQCHKDEDKVLETRVLAQGGVMRRRRMCLHCGFRFTSYERIEERPLIILKRDNSREPFSREKLRNGITTAVRKRPVSQDTIEHMLDDIEEAAHIESGALHELSSADLGTMMVERLKEIDSIAYLRFLSVYRNFDNVDEFIREIKSLSQSHKKKSNTKKPR